MQVCLTQPQFTTGISHATLRLMEELTYTLAVNFIMRGWGEDRKSEDLPEKQECLEAVFPHLHSEGAYCVKLRGGGLTDEGKYPKIIRSESLFPH